MRPPLNAGENVGVGGAGRPRGHASMRPPLNAGENHGRREEGDTPPTLLQ